MMKSTLLFLSERSAPKKILTSIGAFNKVTKRFVAGETLDDAVEAVKVLNAKGITATLDHLGEAIHNQEEAQAEVDMYIRILDRIEVEKLDCNVSLKPTQIGLDVSQDECTANLRAIVSHAAKTSTFVRIDMEDSGHTDSTLDVYRAVRKEFDNVGVVIQAYLFRSEDDIRTLLEASTRIRLCKGAYAEPPEVAWQSKDKVDANFIHLMQILLVSDTYHGIATHDPKMIKATIDFTAEKGISKDSFEFQMLYGVGRDRQVSLVKEGYRMRVYVPYGGAWYPYFMRRLAERPANVMFVLRAMVKG